MPKLLITRPLLPRVREAACALADVEERAETTPLSEAEMLRALREFDAVLPTLGDLFSADIFARVSQPRARMLANFGVGYNHIDVEAARAAGVQVSNTPGAVTDATADIAMMLILMTCRRAAEGGALLQSGAWDGWNPTQLLGTHVTGKVLGVIGMGRIGKAIARRCHYGFDMPVVFFNRSPVAEPGVPARQLGSVAEVAAAADVLVTALPGGPATRHIIGAEVFEAMKPTAHFVNIARGEIVDESALIEALRAGRIAGAGLDVFEHEPHVPQALRDLPNTALLPHLGTAVTEVREAMGLMAVQNLAAFFNGETPPNLV